ncbi:phage replisome organizer N-terminal domain-containing protein [Lactococcus lactis]|uniref:phage replisome organizer N-terminal domain-containing protein n=1 Tax=Lactococcus lactis TaxID=1358 RepID=UPI000BA78C99|nr:phage replisome organizer N-terminal domain-containing protein [Lactococcus lactis]MCX7531115.1 phage replisome organizer N-terminal domain-containing protein [Lactococcus lactis]MDM7474403.1 phage replisome organizer N-terminal domain-containing protein [Lactococcus lactis]MEE0825751.1 phage replisome organizer N-terminal domain-containing protein [Lactococcus lactis]NEX58635.1 DnaD domain protein [Lactococcus lactis]PAK66372.1 prephenate dehydrogenase [Lactococcus lactis]
MADKRYYWFKMEQSFFEQKEIKYLRRLPGGDTYTIIYLKLILKSLENDGKIYYENIVDDYSQEWALEIEEDEKAVSFLVAFLINKGLMIDCGFDEFEITKTKSLVGSETASAERKRRQRERERELLQFNDVTDSQKNVTLSQVGHIESEIEIEKEIDKEAEASTATSTNSDFQNLIELYQANFGIVKPILYDDLKADLEDYGLELIIEAVKRAIKRQREYAYAQGILKSWNRSGIKTLEQAKAEEVSFQNKSQNNQNKFQQQKPTKSTKGLPEWGDEYKLIKAGIDTTGMKQNEMYKLAGEMGLHNE